MKLYRVRAHVLDFWYSWIVWAKSENAAVTASRVEEHPEVFHQSITVEELDHWVVQAPKDLP